MYARVCVCAFVRDVCSVRVCARACVCAHVCACVILCVCVYVCARARACVPMPVCVCVEGGGGARGQTTVHPRRKTHLTKLRLKH